MRRAGQVPGRDSQGSHSFLSQPWLWCCVRGRVYAYGLAIEGEWAAAVHPLASEGVLNGWRWSGCAGDGGSIKQGIGDGGAGGRGAVLGGG